MTFDLLNDLLRMQTIKKLIKPTKVIGGLFHKITKFSVEKENILWNERSSQKHIDAFNRTVKRKFCVDF